jgi:hypothetical protein
VEQTAYVAAARKAFLAGDVEMGMRVVEVARESHTPLDVVDGVEQMETG